MVKSMYAAVAGLRAHQSRMDVISNNISNVNTWGYKSKSASFKESMYQTLTAGSAGSVTDGSYGATNPSMYGYGSLVSAISSNFTQGSPSPTDRNMDLYIDGPSFFMVGPIYGDGAEKNPADCYLSRVGDFEVRNGYLVDSNGRYVYGCPMEKGSETHKIETNVYETGQLDLKKNYTKSVGGITFGTVVKDADPQVEPGDMIEIMENGAPVKRLVLGVEKGTDAQGQDQWTVEYATSDNVTSEEVTVDGDTKTIFTYGGKSGEFCKAEKKGAAYTITYNAPPAVGDIISDTDGFEGIVDSVKFKFIPADHAAGTEEEVITTITYRRVKDKVVTYEGNEIENMEFDTNSGGYVLQGNVNGLKPIKIPTSCDYYDQEAGAWVTENNIVLNSFSVDKNGLINGTSDATGKTYILGSIALVGVLNPNGMTQSDGPYYKLTDSAGTASIVQAGGDNGALSSGYLEMANVDIATEFSTMITTQRGFQANSKIITVTDEMLQELVNMKR